MVELKKIIRLKKELRLIDVFAISAGATLSGGFFLLPGLAAIEAGPALILAYLIAAVPLIPALFSMVELATAMPRAGGVYYFLDRAMGSFLGTIGGIGTWMALILKVAFALIGMGAYIIIFFPKLQILPIAVTLAVILGIINLFGIKKSGNLQIILSGGLILLLILFTGGGVTEVKLSHFKGFFDRGFSSIMSASGLVYISYIGLTKVASLSEEIKNPEKNLPRGIFLALGSALVIYILGTIVMVGVIPIEKLMGDLTPVATAAEYFFGKFGVILLSVAAILAFVSVANAGTMSASRYPLAMSRDHIVPPLFKRLFKERTPVYAIIVTVGSIVLILLSFDVTKIAKLASAFQLLMFALVCLAVIVMRESKIESYDPGYHSPFYPWMQIIGIITSGLIIVEMGWLPTGFSIGLIILATLWYFYYVRRRVRRSGAIYHVFERLGRMRYEGLDRELRSILKEKGLREGDPFDEIVTRSLVIDLDKKAEFSEAVQPVSRWLSQFVSFSEEEITRQFLEGTKIGATPVTHGMALPHLRIAGLKQSEMALVRARKGLHICFQNPLTNSEEEEEQMVKAVFFLVSPEENPTQHLRILAKIAGRVDEESFLKEWESAEDEQELRESLLHDERSLSLLIKREEKSGVLHGKAIREITIPDGCLIAMVGRDGDIFAPRGNTILLFGDRLTVIGDPESMKEFNKLYGIG